MLQWLYFFVKASFLHVVKIIFQIVDKYSKKWVRMCCYG